MFALIVITLFLGWYDPTTLSKSLFFAGIIALIAYFYILRILDRENGIKKYLNKYDIREHKEVTNKITKAYHIARQETPISSVAADLATKL